MEKLFLIDASGYIYRSYFAIRQMTNSKGESTNALFGFIRSLLKLMKDFHPSHIAAIFDGKDNGKSRKAFYPAYKEHRAAMPPDLRYQIAWAEEFCKLAGIFSLSIPEVEADDVMGSIAKWAADINCTVYLCTGDKDLCQLVTDNVFILNTFKENAILGPLEVKQQFGVFPDQIVDYLAITGDASDNVPGIAGFGPKTAAELLSAFGTLDNLLKEPEKVPGKKKQETLIAEKDIALLSKRLVTIDTAVSFPKEESSFSLAKPEIEGLKAFYTEMNFSSLLKELEGSQSPIAISTKKEENVFYELVEEEKALQELVLLLSKQSSLAIDTETTSVRPMEAVLVGIGLGFEEGKAWYVPFNGKLAPSTIIQHLGPLLKNPSIGFYGHNLKYDLHILRKNGLDIATIAFDTLLASYLLNAHSRQHSLDSLSLEHFGKIKIAIETLIGKGKKSISMAEVPIEQVSEYCCEDIDYTIRLKNLSSPKIEERGMHALFYTLELPLLPILEKMEERGIFVDTGALNDLANELHAAIKTLSESIYEIAGEAFNLNSPKQVSHILFDKLGIRPPKKGATGYSTSAEVLELLKTDYPIAEKLLEYRMLEKLRSTYVETLPHQIDPVTKRIHCTFNQSGTATGRLSCQDPNLQNIPVRTAIGSKIREAFRPQKEGWSYLSADYSQIELRLLAHLSEDEALIHAFETNQDIHTFTASQIFSVPLEEVTKEQRHQAKAVNFGIMYGQQAFGLSQELKIDQKKAALFIHTYFERYSKVKAFIDFCKQKARESGKAVTLYGRERLIPEITSSNAILRGVAERLAVNTPIQGTQADLIKMAMLEIDRKIKTEKLQGYMILQIHDELIFEIPDEEIESFTKLVHEAMTTVVKLKIPLIVDINVGKNWKEC